MNKVFFGDCVESLRALPEKIVHTCVTSPPYFGLRSYDENAVVIDPALDDATKDWVIAELTQRGVHAR